MTNSLKNTTPATSQIPSTTASAVSPYPNLGRDAVKALNDHVMSQPPAPLAKPKTMSLVAWMPAPEHSELFSIPGSEKQKLSAVNLAVGVFRKLVAAARERAWGP